MSKLPHSSSELFQQLESFLNSTAKVSLLLWPSGGDKGRGEHLRKCLGVADDNRLATRSARNHLQHFDERLDKWAATTKNGNYIDQNTGSLRAYRRDDGEPVLRHYDPAVSVFTFHSEDFNIAELASEVQKVAAAARDFKPVTA